MTQSKPRVNNNLTVQSHLPDYRVITRDAYIKDVKTRISIHNYEVKALYQQIKDTFTWTKEAYKKLAK